MEERQMEKFAYRCVHYREHFYDCLASSSYEAAKIAAAHWGRKNTNGIDVYKMEAAA
jgi:hypothetical protein